MAVDSVLCTNECPLAFVSVRHARRKFVKVRLLYVIPATAKLDVSSIHFLPED